mgnify:CR=1 FL=1
MTTTTSILNVSRDGARVIVTVTPGGYLGDRGFEFSFPAPNDWSASLLVGALRDALHGAIKRAREEAYADGWRDAKAKRKRATWFSSRLP